MPEHGTLVDGGGWGTWEGEVNTRANTPHARGDGKGKESGTRGDTKVRGGGPLEAARAISASAPAGEQSHLPMTPWHKVANLQGHRPSPATLSCRDPPPAPGEGSFIGGEFSLVGEYPPPPLQTMPGEDRGDPGGEQIPPPTRGAFWCRGEGCGRQVEWWGLRPSCLRVSRWLERQAECPR